VWQNRPSGKDISLSEEIKILGGRGGTARLIEIVRREGGAGGPEALDFNVVNCSNWLNKYVKTALRHLFFGVEWAFNECRVCALI
jgi:hypothetical protein